MRKGVHRRYKHWRFINFFGAKYNITLAGIDPLQALNAIEWSKNKWFSYRDLERKSFYVSIHRDEGDQDKHGVLWGNRYDVYEELQDGIIAPVPAECFSTY